MSILETIFLKNHHKLNITDETSFKETDTQRIVFDLTLFCANLMDRQQIIV